MARDLKSAIPQADALSAKLAGWPPKNNYDAEGRGLVGIMDDEMGFVD
jgi:hypothetical protein